MDDRPSVVSMGNQTPQAPAMITSDVVMLLLTTHEPQELDRIMDRTFGGRTDDTLLTSMVNLAHSFAHTLERYRRRRNLRPLKLRCTECKDKG